MIILGISSTDIHLGKLAHPQKPFFNLPISCCSAQAQLPQIQSWNFFLLLLLLSPSDLMYRLVVLCEVEAVAWDALEGKLWVVHIQLYVCILTHKTAIVHTLFVSPLPTHIHTYIHTCQFITECVPSTAVYGHSKYHLYLSRPQQPGTSHFTYLGDQPIILWY